MATLDNVRPNVRPNGNSFAEGRLKPLAELRAPPLAPNGTTAAENVLLREDAFWPEIEGEDPFQPLAPSNPYETFRSRRKLIAGTAVITALGVAVFTYSFFLASPGAKLPAETAESSPKAVQSSSGTPEPSSPPRVQLSSETPEPSSETPVQPAPTLLPQGASGVVVPSPAVAASLTAEGTPQVAPSAVTPPEFVFLQRPGVNIRSAPTRNAPVLGTAPKGTQFTATSREEDWVQVENTRMKGWINSQFLAPNKPQ
jgi:SH3 domain-containing protein